MYELSTVKEIMQSMANKIRKERISQNKTQEEIAVKCGLSLSTYKKFEREGSGSFENFLAILKGFGKIIQIEKVLEEEIFSPKNTILSKQPLVKDRKRVRKDKIQKSSDNIKSNTPGSFINSLLKKHKKDEESK